MISKLANPLGLFVTVTPRNGDRPHAYDCRGLTARSIKKGVYRIRRSDGKPLNMVTSAVRFAEPWATEKVLGLVPACRTHGVLCAAADESCKLYYRRTKIARWCAFIRVQDAHTFDVCILARPRTKQPTVRDRIAQPEKGAGFFVHLLCDGGK